MGEAEEKRGDCSTASSDAFRGVVGRLVRFRWLVVPGYLLVCGLVLWQIGGRLGTELFPQVDSGEFVLRFRPPPGSNFELTRQMAVKCLEEIEQRGEAARTSRSRWASSARSPRTTA